MALHWVNDLPGVFKEVIILSSSAVFSPISSAYFNSLFTISADDSVD